MKTILIVDKVSLQVLTSYQADAAPSAQEQSLRYGGPWGNSEATAHLELAEGLDARAVKIEMDGDEMAQSEDEDKASALEDAAWEHMRAERNARLAACDYTQLADAPMSSEDKAAFAAYRQELRDLPEQTEDPANPAWPEQP